MAIRVRRHRSVGLIAGSLRGWYVATLAAAFAVLLPLTTFLVAAWLMGWQLQAVLSGSMSPSYPVGSLLVIGAVDASSVDVGMPIVFEDPRQPGHLVVHRVVARAPGDALQFITQGDANASRDPAAVPARLVRGRVLWQVSRLGTLLDWLQWPRSFLLLVVLPGAALGWDWWMSRRRGPDLAHQASASLIP
jgi:signal peptidase I